MAPPARRTSDARPPGLPGLRRPGTVTELLFLYECLIGEPSQLRPVAESLGLTVQAASHTFRGLTRRGLAEVRDGRYRATVKGVAWLHATLGNVADDLRGRLGRLHVIRTTRAIAGADLAADALVSLELVDGLLTATPGGAGASRGITRGVARQGELIAVGGLEGIVPLARATVRVLTVADVAVNRPETITSIRKVVGEDPVALLAAPGLEGYHLLRRATERAIVRFAVAEACAEASRVGVPSLVVVLETELPRFLAPLAGADPPPFSVERLPVPGRRRAGRGRRAPAGSLRAAPTRRRSGPLARATGTGSPSPGPG
jgi:predicted transcriptional regulator